MRIIVSGGGTGGHIYPALALIETLQKKQPNSVILYIGSYRGLESSIIPKYGLPFKQLSIQGFSRKISLNNIRTLFMFLNSFRKSKKILLNFAPDIVLGTGGYVSGAVLLAAQYLKIPTVINEQNTIPGITNKFLAKKANKIAISFPDAKKYFSKKKVVLTGNPRGQQVLSHTKFNLEKLGLKSNLLTILIFGGSGGALKINQSAIGFLKRLSKYSNLQGIFVTGKKYYSSVIKEIKKQDYNFSSRIKIFSYLNNMDKILPKISLLISRSGATTLAEITSLGIPSILIPSPNVTANHQEKNARQLESVGASKVILENSLTSSNLFNEMIKIVKNPSNLKIMGNSAKRLGRPDAANRLYHLLIKVIDQKNNKK